MWCGSVVDYILNVHEDMGLFLSIIKYRIKLTPTGKMRKIEITNQCTSSNNKYWKHGDFISWKYTVKTDNQLHGYDAVKEELAWLLPL